MKYDRESIIQSKKLLLRKTTREDLSFVTVLESILENRRFIIPWSLEKHCDALKNQDVIHLIIEDIEKNNPVGYAILAGINNPNESIELIRITIAEKGEGYGKEALKLIKNYVFVNLSVHRLWLDVKVNNVRAIHVYKSQGFVVEGKLRECLKVEDEYESLLIMSMLKKEYLEDIVYRLVK